MRTINIDNFELIQNMNYGFALHKVITNGSGEPVDYVFLEINKAYEELTGLKRDNLLNKKVTEILPHLDKQWIEKFGQVALTGEPVEIIDYVQDLDRYYKTKAYRPKMGYFAVTFNDISERKRAERKLIENQKQLKSILNNTPAILMLVDKNHKIVNVNAEGIHYSGINYEETLGKKCGDILLCKNSQEHPLGCGSSKMCRECIVNQSLENAIYNGKSVKKVPVINFKKKSGSIQKKSFLLTSEVIEEQENDLVLITLEDITKQKETEHELQKKQWQLKESNEEYLATNEELRQINEELFEINERLYHSENKYKDLFDHAQSALYRTRIEDGKLLECNKFFADLLEFDSVEDCLNNFSVEKIYVDPSDRGKMKGLLNELGEFKDRIIEVKTAKNNIKWVKYSGKAYYDKDYLEGGVNDITSIIRGKKELVLKQQELREKNEEYQALNEELRQRNSELHTLNQVLSDTKKRLQESDRLKTAFLANISHEIRTPLNGVVGFTELLHPGMAEEKFKQFVEIIINSSQQLTSIIDNILDLSKIEVGVIRLKKSKFKVNHELQMLYNEFEMQVKEKNLSFNLSTSPHEFIVDGDKTRFIQIFYNLLGNAIKFTDEGSIEFGIKQIQHQPTFFVTDTGLGINKTDLPHIFDHFRQADTGQEKLYNGAGIGLSLVRSFVELMGGKVWIESTPNRGSTFYFTLSGMEQSALEEKQETGTTLTENYNWVGKHILVVEDSLVNQQLIIELLSPHHPVVLVASNGIEAIKLLKEYPSIDLVLLDIKMPVMDGFETINRIREMDKELPVIAQTAHAFADEKEKILACGFNAYLSKPLKEDVLIAEVHKFLVKTPIKSQV